MTGAAIASAFGEHHTFGLDTTTVLATSGGVTTVEYSLQSDGDIEKVEAGVTTDIGDWISPKDSFSKYEVRATLVSGTLTSGTVDSWLNLGSTQTWTKTNAAAGTTAVAEIDLELRQVNSTFVRDTARITLSAERL